LISIEFICGLFILRIVLILALFSLRPVRGNERAERVVSHQDNSHYVSTLSDGALALDDGFHIRVKSSKTLATLGRGVEADIYVEGSSIAKVQCSFEIDLDTGVIMLYDRSFAKSSQVFGENATPFEYERSCKVLVQEDLNTILRVLLFFLFFFFFFFFFFFLL
jgi:hypothetical protein